MLIQTKETAGLSQEEYIAMAAQWGLSGTEIIEMADLIGIHLDELEKDRIINIQAQIDKDFYANVNAVKTAINGIGTGYMMGLGYSKGGIVGYANGGIVGNDGAKIPPLTASMGIVTPQTGRAIPVMAHENEVILNTGQQKNLAELIFNTANKGNAGSGGVTIENFNVITPTGSPAEIARETQLQLRLMGMEASI